MASYSIQKNNFEPFENSHFPCKRCSREKNFYPKVTFIQTDEIFSHVGLFRQGTLILRQFSSMAGCVQSFILAQNCRLKIYDFWPILTLLLEQQIKFVLISWHLVGLQ